MGHWRGFDGLAGLAIFATGGVRWSGRSGDLRHWRGFDGSGRASRLPTHHGNATGKAGTMGGALRYGRASRLPSDRTKATANSDQGKHGVGLLASIWRTATNGKTTRLDDLPRHSDQGKQPARGLASVWRGHRQGNRLDRLGKAGTMGGASSGASHPTAKAKRTA